MSESINPVNGNGRILIVDDNVSNVRLLEKVLSLSGYKDFRSATDPRIVPDLCREFDPDVLLLDLNMPWLNGFELLEIIQQQVKNSCLAVIVITAQSEHENRMRALRMGVNDFVGKPFDSAEVIMRIRNMLQFRRMNLQLRDQNRQMEQANLLLEDSNRLLEFRVALRTQELQDTQIELVSRLVRAVEFRDHVTGNHVFRIGKYAEILGELLGMRPEQCSRLNQAATMHDIGKIGIADQILHKNGPLNDDEWIIMKNHTLKGGEILAGSNLAVLQLGEQVAKSHHERWDGTGYPLALSGEDIPIAGRIVAVCDVFDALMAKRPYKEAMSLEKSLEIIRNGEGTHFDPALARLFLDHLPRFLAVWEAWQDPFIAM